MKQISEWTEFDIINICTEVCDLGVDGYPIITSGGGLSQQTESSATGSRPEINKVIKCLNLK